MFCFENEDKVQNQYMIRCLVKHSIENKLPNTFKLNKKKTIIKNENKKYSRRGCYGTDTIPLSQTALFDIKCLKWNLKDISICLDLAY